MPKTNKFQRIKISDIQTEASPTKMVSIDPVTKELKESDYSAAGASGDVAEHTQGAAATLWTFVHNLGHLKPLMNYFDENGEEIIPWKRVPIDTDTTEIYWKIARAGSAVAMVGGASTPLSTGLYTGDLGVTVQGYDADLVSDPNYIATDNNFTNAYKAEVDANTLKTGITAQQAADITANNAKVGITAQQASDITANNAKNSYPTADSDKVANITVTQPVDLDDIETRVNDLDASVVLKGVWDASAGTFPGGGTAQAGHSYIVSVAGTVDSVSFNINDRIIAILDNASAATFASNWHNADYTDEVLSVAGKTGAVSLVKGDVGLGNVDNTADSDKPISTAQQTGLDGKEDSFAKNTAFNKNFGAGAGDVAEGNDSRLSDARTPTAHNHTASEITDFDTEVSNNADVVANSAKTGAFGDELRPSDIGGTIQKKITVSTTAPGSPATGDLWVDTN